MVNKSSFKKLNLPVDKLECLAMPESAPPNRLEEYVDYLKKPASNQSYVWKIPNINKKLYNCVIRIRYNISTNEVLFNFTNDDNYKLKNNPEINTTFGVPVRLAIDTRQYGRTFEDRTFTFDIIKSNLSSAIKIINVNVQGKRGNIAQIRNCIEYDFIPNNITVRNDDYIHFKWVGSDYNPIENDGEWRAGTDRSNLVFIDDIKNNMPICTNQPFNSQVLIELASIGQPYNNNTQCKSPNDDKQSLDNCAILNYAPPYFNMKLIKINANNTRTFYAFSTHNNNFSNRDQKLTLHYIDDSQSTADKLSLVFFGIIVSIIIGVLICIFCFINYKSNIFTSIKKYVQHNCASKI